MSEDFKDILSKVEGGEALVQKFGRDTLAESIAALASSYRAAESQMHKGPRPPGSPDEYKPPEGASPEAVGRAREAAFEAAMTQQQFERLVGELGGAYAQEVDRSRAAKEGIEKAYGDEYNRARARALRAAEDLRAQGTEVGSIDSNPGLFQALERLGATMADDTGPLDTTPADGGQPSITELKDHAAKARAIMEGGGLDRNSPTFAASHREYEEAMMALMKAGFESAFDPRLLDEYDPYRRLQGLD